MAPSHAVEQGVGYKHWMAGTFPHSGGMRYLVSTLFWETGSILVQ